MPRLRVIINFKRIFEFVFLYNNDRTQEINEENSPIYPSNFLDLQLSDSNTFTQNL